MKQRNTWRRVLSWEVQKPVWRRGNHYNYQSTTKGALPVITVEYEDNNIWEVYIQYPEKGKYVKREENLTPGGVGTIDDIGSLTLMELVKSFKGKDAYFRASQFADALAIEKGYIRMRGFEELENAKKLSAQELSDKQLDSLSDVLDIQGSEGNWNYKGDPNYMTGMYNGMELMDSIVDNRDPKFKDVPKKASLKLSWEVEQGYPGNPNRYSIEALKDELKLPGITLKTFDDLVEYFTQHNILVNDNVLSALEMYSREQRFSGYVLYYNPLYNSTDVFLEVKPLFLANQGDILVTGAPLRIY